MSTTAPAERLLSIEVGRRFPLDGVDVRAIAAADGPEGLVALSGRQGLWLAAPEDASGERCLTRAISKDAAGKWLDLGSVSWCPELRKAGCLAAVRQRSLLLWDAGVGRSSGTVDLPASVRAVTDLHWGDHLVTGAMDGSVRLHDHRDVRNVVCVFGSKVNGHTQVRVNRKAPVLVASAHAGHLLIWDVRQPKKPRSSIIAHVSNKVGKFDWGQYASSDHIVTCSPMESDVKSWKVEAAHMEAQPSPAATLRFSSYVASTLMSPSGALVLTAHADARIRVSALPRVGLPEDVPREPQGLGAMGGGGGGVQKAAQVLLSFPTSSPVERRIDVAKPMAVTGARGGEDGGGGGEGAGDFRVVAVTGPVGASAPSLREWLITSKATAAAELTEKPGGGILAVGGWGGYLEHEEEAEEEAEELAADLWGGELLPAGIAVTAISAEELDVRYGLTHMPVIHLHIVLPPRRRRAALESTAYADENAVKPKVVQVLAPAGDRFRSMRKSITKLFLGEADSLLTRVSAVQGLVQDCLTLQQEVSTGSSDDGIYSDDFLSDSSEDKTVDVESPDQLRTRAGGVTGDWEGPARTGGISALGPFHPLLILSNLNAVARREREKVPESKNIRPPDLFTVRKGDSLPEPRTAGGVWSPMGVLWVWKSAGRTPGNGQTGTSLSASPHPARAGEQGGQQAGQVVSSVSPGHSHSGPPPAISPVTSRRVRREEWGSAELRGREPMGGGEHAGVAGDGGVKYSTDTPMRRLAQRKAFFGDDDVLDAHADLLVSPAYAVGHPDPARRLDRPESDAGSAGGAGASSVGDIERAEVRMHFSQHVPVVDIPLAQALRMRCAARKSFVKVCQENSNAALQAGRTDVAQTWKVAAFADIRIKEVVTWALQPTGRTLLCTLVQHHAQHCDFQTVAALLAVFVSAFGSSVLLSAKWREPRVASSPAAPLQAADPPVAPARDVRGSSFGGKDPLLGYHFYQDDKDSDWSDSWHWQAGETADSVGVGGRREWGGSAGGAGGSSHKGRRAGGEEEVSDLELVIRALLGDEVLAGLLPRHLDGARAPLAAATWGAWCVTHYMDVLFAYRLLDVVALLRDIFPLPLRPGATHWSSVTLQYRLENLAVSSRLTARGSRVGGGAGGARGVLQCSVCRLPVFGVATTCSKCGHGGHVHHLKFWFSKYSICATGCGCQCHSE